MVNADEAAKRLLHASNCKITVFGGLADARPLPRPMVEHDRTGVMGSEESAPRGCASMTIGQVGGSQGLATAFRSWTRSGPHGGGPTWQPRDYVFSLIPRKTKKTRVAPPFPF